MRSKLQKRKACYGVNWPSKGWNIHTGLPANLAIPLTVIFIFSMTVGCDAGLVNQLVLSTPNSSTSELLPTLVPSPSPILLTEEVTSTEEPLLTPDAESCLVAVAGNPLDVSIPDGTILDPGEEFIKIWRITNTGTCEWTSDYTIEWFSGDILGITNETKIINPVRPGETVDIAIDMIAPLKVGVYQSNWKICDPAKVCFGLGPNGAYPFWARIQVRQLITVTPSSMPTLTPPAVVFLTGQAELSFEESFDLDKGKADQTAEADIQFILTDAGLTLNALNKAKIALFGVALPEEADCLSLLEETDSAAIGTFEPSDTICFQSTQGLPGVIQMNRIDLEGQLIEIEYLTWYAP